MTTSKTPSGQAKDQPSEEAVLAEGKRLLKLIEQDVKQRRADPVGTVTEAARILWSNQSSDEAAQLFAHMMQTTPWWAQDVVWSLHQVTEKCPENIGEVLFEAAGIWLTDDPKSSPQVYCDWLVEQTKLLEAAVDQTKKN
jgi:hypothetical protein